MNDDAKPRATRAASELRETDGAFDKMRATALEAFFASKASDVALREEIYRSVQTIDAVQKHLKMLVASGEIEAFADTLRKSTEG